MINEKEAQLEKNYWDLGDIVIKRAELSDADVFLDFLLKSSEDADRSYEKLKFPPSIRSVEDWIKAYFISDGNDRCIFTIFEKTGGLVGFIEVWEADRRMGTYKFGIEVAEEKSGKGYASRALVKVLDFYFNELRYQKSDVYIYDFNARSLNFHKKVGFIEEGKIRRQCYTKGKYHDAFFYGMTAEEFNEKYKESLTKNIQKIYINEF
jgi:RimJ/RimL family protein N-acetyltransferase